MRTFFVLLLAADLAIAAWLGFGTPPDMLREPGRVDLQIAPERFRILTDAELARRRQQSAAAATTAASTAASAAAVAVGGNPMPATSANAPVASRDDATPPDLPSPACVEIGDFAQEAAARKVRARLVEAVPEEHISTTTVDKLTRLRVTAVTASIESRLDRILKDFPRQHLSHCAEPAAATAATAAKPGP